MGWSNWHSLAMGILTDAGAAAFLKATSYARKPFPMLAEVLQIDRIPSPQNPLFQPLPHGVVADPEPLADLGHG